MIATEAGAPCLVDQPRKSLSADIRTHYVESDTIFTLLYFVIGPDGSKYGPADIPTLQSWVAQGRITPDTILEEQASRQRVAARLVAGLSFGEIPAGLAPVKALRSPKTEYTKGFDDGSQDVIWSYICSALSIICCGLFVIGGFVYASRAISKGNERGRGARVFAIIMTIIWIVTTIIEIIFIGQLKDYVMGLVNGQSQGGF